MYIIILYFVLNFQRNVRRPCSILTDLNSFSFSRQKSVYFLCAEWRITPLSAIRSRRRSRHIGATVSEPFVFLDVIPNFGNKQSKPQTTSEPVGSQTTRRNIYNGNFPYAQRRHAASWDSKAGQTFNRHTAGVLNRPRVPTNKRTRAYAVDTAWGYSGRNF